MASRKDYYDGCAASHALDLVGERWALLVVRELMLGPKRFTDLRTGLPQLSPNVLSQRLRELEEAGVVLRRRLPPPAASAVYELTDWGLDLEPVLQTLGRWGVRSPSLPASAHIGLDSFVLAMRTMFDPVSAAGVEVTLDLRLGEQTFRARVADGRCSVDPGAAANPDAVVAAEVDALAAVVFDGRPFDAAVEAGDLVVTGDAESVRAFVALFPMPEPAAPRRVAAAG